MDFFPVFINLRGQAVVLAGAGAVAERKARLLLQAGAQVRVVARELNTQFRTWVEAGQIEHCGLEYAREQLQGARLVFAATSDPELNRRIYQDAEQAGLLANVVDDPAHCRFISPAVIDRSPVQVAISTGGSSPVLARVIRGWIERLLPLGLGRVASGAGAMRQAVKTALPQSLRRGFWEQVLQEKSIRSWSLQDGEQIQRQMQSALDERSSQSLDVNATGPAGRSGKVFLVGGGPGRADLLTLRALHVLGQADVILHDQLVSEEVLDLARRDADRIDVGKRAGDHHRSQQQIHEIMVAEARKGRTVVRLKGGDPFIFGRGGEELEYLRDHGIAFEVVPGISAALGCAAYSGIPLTHRDHAAALTFVTGHGASTDSSEGGHTTRDWRAIAGPGKTAVVYMGLKQAARIRSELLQSGISSELPVALVANGSRDQQRVVLGTVDELAQLAAAVEPGAPTLLIIGQVAALGSTLSWFQQQPALLAAA
jgi:uroporphyrin-III C-methyltransferase/precorrin-2 dehydrogenase/sirohydrochlorin ferrochelatase